MAENLVINDGSKKEQYETLLPQLKALTVGETDAVANMANIAAALRQTFGFFWVGFYRVINIGTIPRPVGLHAHPLRERRMRHSLERSPHNHRSGCR